MALPYITLGSPTTGGGKVISGQSSYLIDGKAVACVGDKATCPKHKCVATIIAGDNHMIIMGKAAAQHNSPLSCGCKCIGNQQMHLGDNGGGSSIAKSNDNKVATTNSFANNVKQTENSVTFYFKNQLTQEPIVDFFYSITLPSGEQIEGHTDEEGKTDLTTTGIKATDVKIETFDLSKPMDKWE